MSHRLYSEAKTEFLPQVLQGGGLESPTKPKGRPKKNSIPSSEQLSEQERSTAEADRPDGSSSHLENAQEEWPASLSMNLWDAQSAWKKGDFLLDRTATWCKKRKEKKKKKKKPYRNLTCTRRHPPAARRFCGIPSWCCCWGGDSNICSRSNSLYSKDQLSLICPAFPLCNFAFD